MVPAYPPQVCLKTDIHLLLIIFISSIHSFTSQF